MVRHLQRAGFADMAMRLLKVRSSAAFFPIRVPGVLACGQSGVALCVLAPVGTCGIASLSPPFSQQPPASSSQHGLRLCGRETSCAVVACMWTGC
jgi:hypothetical protein